VANFGTLAASFRSHFGLTPEETMRLDMMELLDSLSDLPSDSTFIRLFTGPVAERREAMDSLMQRARDLGAVAPF
jgi:hypothetical protein